MRSRFARGHADSLRIDTQDQPVISVEIHKGQTSVIREILMTISDRSENLKRRIALWRLRPILEIPPEAHAFECPITAHVQETQDASGLIT
jgi:hypothetical protein